VLSVLLLTSTLSVAEEPVLQQVIPEDLTPAEEDEVPSSVLVNVGNFVDTAQQLTSDRFNRFVLQIDGFFGDAESEAETKRSWGRIRIDSIKPGDGEAVKLGGLIRVATNKMLLWHFALCDRLPKA